MKHISEHRSEELSVFPELMTPSEKLHLENCEACSKLAEELQSIHALVNNDVPNQTIKTVDLTNQIMSKIEPYPSDIRVREKEFPFATFGLVLVLTLLIVFINYTLIIDVYTSLENALRSNNLFTILLVVLAYLFMKGLSTMSSRFRT